MFTVFNLVPVQRRVRRGNQRAVERQVIRAGCYCREVVIVAPNAVTALVYPKRWDMFLNGSRVASFYGRERQRRAKAWLKQAAAQAVQGREQSS